MATSPLKILIVSQMYPGPGNPDLGVFVQGQERALVALGHDVDVVAVTRRGGGVWKHLGFAVRAITRIWRERPEVVYAHFLAPAGVLAAFATLLMPRCALVVVAHGRDVRNIGTKRGVAAGMRLLARRADVVIAVSQFLGDDLVKRAPQFAERLTILDAGVDVQQVFTPGAREVAQQSLGGRWPTLRPGPVFLFVGTFDERKNVRRLAQAFAALDTGSLVLVGDGPLRSEFETLQNVHLVGRVDHHEVVTWMRACDVLCLPSTVEPFGQVLIEAMACERSVVATAVGGPPEFVPPEAGVIVDPLSVDDIARGIREAAALPMPNHAARVAALDHDVRRQAERIAKLMRAARSTRA